MSSTKCFKIESKTIVYIAIIVIIVVAITDNPTQLKPKLRVSSSQYLPSRLDQHISTDKTPDIMGSSSRSVTIQDYMFHPSCQCSRPGPNLSLLEKTGKNSSGLWTNHVEDGVYVGKGTCDDYTSALGAGQKVLSYSYYPPVSKQHHNHRFHPKETIMRYLRLMNLLIDKSTKLYPEWRIRIYHNITDYRGVAGVKLCQLYCQYKHVDMCDMGQYPEKYPYGMFWRFQPLGDPTVRMFASRDLDSYLLWREVFAVKEWIESNKQFHVMRDGPMHGKGMLGGLWGANNYKNLTFANLVKKSLWNSMLKNKVRDHYGLDMEVLLQKVWPLIRKNESMIHDSYHCHSDAELYGPTRPWPTRREGRIYVGYGPERRYALRRWMRPCPKKCRPKNHQNWLYC